MTMEEELVIEDSDVSTKVFNDPIHGHIDLHPLCVAIIDTPQFQRLRYIKQIGGGYFVFPGASHNRFEHSLGVCHLAGEFVKTLRDNQPELDITDKDILCEQIAGLCHDLGHGPFSHVFDNMFIKEAKSKSRKEAISKPWQHEQASVDMLDHLIEENELKKRFEKHGLYDIDMTFIKELINGPLPGNAQEEWLYKGRDKNKSFLYEEEWPYKGRDKNKSFLYEIVANKRNGIDVDKWDYFSRDCHHLGISANFDHSRFMKFSRVIKNQICYRDKEIHNVYNLFYARSSLHRRASKHKTTTAIELMLKDALLAADKHVEILGSDGHMRKISECIDDMVAMTKLTDNIYHTILHSPDQNLQPAREILQRIESRRLYKFIGERRHDGVEKEDKIAKAISSDGDVTEKDVIVWIVKFDYGKEDENPIDSVRFYKKGNLTDVFTEKEIQISQMLPANFSEQFVRVYCRSNEKTTYDKILKSYKNWSDQKEKEEMKRNASNSRNEDMPSPDETPDLTQDPPLASND